MKIAYLSDIHIEFHLDGGRGMIRGIDNAVKGCDVVILAGDIGVLIKTYDSIKNLLSKLSRTNRYVFYIPGNHEFYGSSYGDGGRRLQRLRYEAPTNVMVPLDYYYEFQVDDYLICGGTAWFGNLSPSQDEKNFLSDFSQIGGLEQDIYRENTHFISMVGNACERHDHTKVLVASHHAPSYQSVDPRFANSRLNGFFVNNWDEQILEAKPKLWIHGHCHDAVDYYIGDTNIISNPAGYPHEISAYWAPEIIEVR